MKKLFILMMLCTGISLHGFSQASALQNCYSGGTTSIPTRPQPTFGLTPSDSVLPCSVDGVATVDTIFFTNLTSVSGFTLNSLTIDSLYLPSGLCWKTSSATNTFAGGGSGVILVTGTTNALPGQYKLRIIVSANVGFTISNLNAESYGLVYKIRVRNSSCPCTTIDNSRADSALVFIPYATSCPPTATISPSGNDTICQGTSATLTANSGTGYTYKWSNASHSTSQSISVNTAGSYHVTVYNPAGDSAVSANTTVVISPTPSAVLTLRGPAAICPGNTDTITAPAGYTYHWNAAGGNATTQSIFVTSAGSYVVTVTNSNGCSAVSAPQVITNSGSCGGLPVAIITPAGHDTICTGDSVTLTATSGAGYSFKWSTGATTQSITVSTGGAYTLTVFHAPDSAVSAPTTVVLAPSPSSALTLTGSATFCTGDSVTITAPAGLFYAWSNTATSRSITVSAAGSYTVTVTNTRGCRAVSTPQVVTVNVPHADTITRSGLILTSQAQSAYQWYQSTTALTGQTTATYTATQNGTYTVAYTDVNGCHGVSNSITITGVGIFDITSDIALKIFPNPSEGMFTLQTSGCEGNYYEISDELGRTIQKNVILSDNTSVDVSGQNGGVYYLTVRNGQQHGTIRFVVLKK